MKELLAEKPSMSKLNKSFKQRQALIDYVAKLSGHSNQEPISPIIVDNETAKQRLNNIHPSRYGKTRNYLTGDVTQLSPFISSGMLSTQTVYQHARAKVSSIKAAEKFFQELAWREYWQQVAKHHPQWLWQDAQPYKTGFNSDDYAEQLPNDILTATTDCACINQLIQQLVTTGYLHNHARMYLAAYVVHWRKIKWQAGAAWFLYHLLDANIASNNLSWQWVASTFSHKPYIFNLENVAKYADSTLDTSAKNNQPLDASYQQLTQTLFPNLNSHD